MIGLALEGGADRCAFTAGVVDVLMRHQFYASAASRTSAGAGCVLNYRSKQPGLFRQMMLMQNEKPYFGICHMLRTGRFLNLNEMASQYAEQRCQKVIVVLTGHDGCQPTDYRKFRPLLSVAYRKRYPALHHALLHRIARYQEQIVRMQQAQKTGAVFVIQPEVRSIPLFTRDTQKIDQYYRHGCELTERIWPALETWLSAENMPKSYFSFLS